MADVLGDYATSYELDTALRLDIEDMVTMLSPFDAPFLGTYNGLENAPVPSALPTGDVFEVQYDWLDDELLLPRSTIDTAYTAADGVIVLATGGAAGFQADDLVDVLLTDGTHAQFLVDSVAYATDTLTVTLWSGSDGNAASGNAIEGIGTVPVEGGDPVEARATDRDRRHNFTQIFGPYPVELTETEQVVLKYGVTNEWDHQTAKRVKEAMVACEQAIIYGVRKNDTTNKRRSMGGIDYYVTAANGSTVDSSTTDLSGTAGEAAFLTLQQDAYGNGGDPRLVVVGPAQKPNVSAWRKTDIRFQMSEQRRGQIVTSFESDFGMVDVLMHRWVRSTDLFLFNPEQAEIATLNGRGLKWVMTAKTGDRDQAYVITEKGFKFRAPQHAAKMNALT